MVEPEPQQEGDLGIMGRLRLQVQEIIANPSPSHQMTLITGITLAQLDWFAIQILYHLN